MAWNTRSLFVVNEEILKWVEVEGKDSQKGTCTKMVEMEGGNNLLKFKLIMWAKPGQSQCCVFREQFWTYVLAPPLPLVHRALPVHQTDPWRLQFSKSLGSSILTGPALETLSRELMEQRGEALCPHCLRQSPWQRPSLLSGFGAVEFQYMRGCAL